MRKFHAFGAIATLALAAPFAAATDFSYNLIEGTYLSGDDFSGFGVSGAMEFTGEFFGLASIHSLDFDNSSTDGSLLAVSAGYSRALNNALDLIATAGLKRVKVDGLGSDTGFGIGVGARGKLLERLELHGGLEYVDIDESDTVLRFGGRWYFTPQFAAGLDVQDDDSGSTLMFSGRYDFGNRM